MPGPPVFTPAHQHWDSECSFRVARGERKLGERFVVSAAFTVGYPLGLRASFDGDMDDSRGRFPDDRSRQTG